MSEIDIQLDGGANAYIPGERVAGSVTWRLAERPTGVEVRLFWYTRGKGTTDVHVVKAQQFDAGGTGGSGRFQFVLPDQPYSFSGKLISLIWAVEAVAQPGDRSARVEVAVGPGGREVLLGAGGENA